MANTTVKSGRWSGRNLIVLAVFIWVAACDGGCDTGCGGFVEQPYPEEHYNKTVPGSAEVRLSSHGLNFMSTEVDNLIGQFMEDGLSFCVPPTDADQAEFCHRDSTCADGSTGCQIDLSIDDAQLAAEAPNRLIVEITIGDLLEQLPVTVNLIGSTDCTLEVFGDDEDIPAQVPVDAVVAFEIDEQSALNDTRIEVEDVQVYDSGIDFDLTGNVACSGYNFVIGLVEGMLRDMIQDEVQTLVDDMSDELLCRSCEDGDPACPSNSTCEANDDDALVCMYDEDTCVPMLLGVQGMLVMEELIGDMTARGAADVYLTSRLADRAAADTGLSLAMRSGFEPSYYSTCVPVDPTTRPSFDAIDPSPAINSDTKPNGDPFMLGVGIHRTTIQHLMWSMWATGGLCIEIGADTVDMLTTSAIGALVEGVGDLSTRQAPVEIRLSPQNMPVVELGENIVEGDEVVDGLLNVKWEDLDIHMYGYLQERYARMFTLRADLDLPVGLVADEEGLLPVLGDVEAAIGNLRVLNKELVQADVETFEELIPMLLGFALPDLLESLSDPIELPEFAGYRVDIGDGDLTSVDDGDVLALFASLEYVGLDPEALMARVQARIDDQQIEVERSGRLPRVRANIDVSATVADMPVDTDSVDYLYRLNDGAWMPAGQGPRLALDHPSLSVQGEHRLELMARRNDDGGPGQRWPTESTVLVDYEAPTVEVFQEETTLVVDAFDVVDDQEELSMRHRVIADGQRRGWSAWGDVEDIDLSHLANAQDLRMEVEVRDRSGQSSRTEMAVHQRALYAAEATGEGPTTQEPAQTGGCASTGGSTGSLGLFLLLALGLFGWRRRKRGALLALSAVVAVMVSGCSGCSDETSSQSCEAECPSGEACIDGECTAPTCNDIECEDLNCPDGQLGVCDDGTCVCQDYCASGCEEAQFCCQESNSCQDFDDPCADTECDDGYETQVTHLGDADPDTCEVTNSSCECVAMDPIDLRIHGSYLSVDEGPDQETVAVSVYNMGYGDLMVGVLGGGKMGVEDWYFVDGVPDTGVIAGDPEGPRGGIITSGRDAGTHTATAIDGEGVIHVFYRHEDDESLKYARGIDDGQGYEFELTTVEDDVDSGYFTALVEQEGLLHLVYTARLSDTESEMRYRAIAVDTAVDEMSETSMTVIHSGEETEAEGLEGYPRVAGLFPQLSVDEQGLFLSFYDYTQGQAGWMSHDGEAGWSEPTFWEDPVDPYVSARRDANGDVHLAYSDETVPGLFYRSPAGDVEMIVDGIRDTANGWSEMPVGEDVQLHVGDGGVEVLYHDATTHELKRAIGEDGSWDVLTLAGEAGVAGAAHGLFVRRLPTSQGHLVVDFSVDHTVDEEQSMGQPTFRFID